MKSALGEAGYKRLFSRVFSRAPVTGHGVEEVLKQLRSYYPKADVSLVMRAYETARDLHQHQKRHSGEPYITHPVAVALILTQLGMGPRGICAALLHDTVEDTDYSLEKLKDQFGGEIALLVDGVTKLDRMTYGDSAQSETYRKMIVSLSKDIRVLVIKLADRLHNARTWGFVPAESAQRKARETLEIYAPLAHRLGIQPLKTELEDLSFMVLEPKIYKEITAQIKKRSPEREKTLREICEQIQLELRKLRIRGEVKGRPKEVYSIYQKMMLRGREFNEIHDLVGIRVLVPTVRDCYAALGSMHTRWSPVQGRFKDYIAMPKFNLYQSIHTTVLGPGGTPVEIQIRTYEMHRRAEYGIAAHWKYKEQVRQAAAGGAVNKKNTSVQLAPEDEQKLLWLSRVADWQDNQDPEEFLEAMRYELGAKDLYVFSPKGRVIGLPGGSTPVDFAYTVHTEVGHRTIGAKVNGRMVALDYQLSTGDVVEILTTRADNFSPNKNWLNFVRSARARNKIRNWFTKEHREELIEKGRELLAKAVRRQKLSARRLLNAEHIRNMAGELSYENVSELYKALGHGSLSVAEVVGKLTNNISSQEDEEVITTTIPIVKPKKTHKLSEPTVTVRGVDDVLVKLARCCTPLPADKIVGYVTRGSGVSVHQVHCSNIKNLEVNSNRLVQVEWRDRVATHSFTVQIQVEGLNRPGLLSDITRVFSENHVNIASASVQSMRHLTLNRFVCEMTNISHLDKVLAEVRRIDMVYDAYRTNA